SDRNLLAGVPPDGATGVKLDAEFRILLDSLRDGVHYSDRKRRIQFWNRAAESLTGFSEAEVVGKGCADNILMHVNAEGKCLCTSHHCPLLKCFKGATNHVERVYLHHKEGHRVPVRISASPVRNAEGEIIGGLEIFHEISEEMATLQAMAALKEEALLCPLTGVGNRRGTEDIIEKYLTPPIPGQATSGLLFIDVDHFKSINDRYGHQVGDIVLKMVAKTLAKDLRGLDFLGRWGGEEFVAILPQIGIKALAETAERLRALVESSSMEVSQGKLKVTVSVGATTRAAGEDVASVMARADALMYASKNGGRNKVTVG
ncbi:MAG: sensor domain-containing diguanylate cyclase, partial [Gammaproteobacteria bacterium]|nr:sensor domain-containing diguanylate cyclase [Gammaproteobacteria bacterium]